jgi:hypothetical protein
MFLKPLALPRGGLAILTPIVAPGDLLQAIFFRRSAAQSSSAIHLRRSSSGN